MTSKADKVIQLLPDACLNYIENEIIDKDLGNDDYDRINELHDTVDKVYRECYEMWETGKGFKAMCDHLESKNMGCVAEQITETITMWEQEEKEQAEEERIKAQQKAKADAIDADAAATEQLTLI